MASDDSQRLHIEQTQQQRLLPLQVRVGRMLEMNAIEVEEEVKRALEELPALEVADKPEPEPQTEENDIPFSESSEEMQLADYRNDDDIPAYRFEASNRSRDDGFYEPVAVASEGSLIDSLSRQLSEIDMNDEDRLIVRYIIGNIDDNGYMGRDMNSITDDIAIQTGLDVTTDRVRQVWSMVRGLDPAGIAATDLRDCLLLQLKRRSPSQAVNDAREIIADYFDIFAKKHFDRIASMMSLPLDRLKSALTVIRQLNPKPGSEFTDGGIEENSRHIVPDFLIETDNDRITLTLLNNLPELTIEKTFSDDALPVDDAASARQRREAQTFIRQHRDEARDFIKILRTRQETLFRVMSAIVTLQHDFFISEDPRQIKPMILKDIAAITGDDLSVISRATASKYVATQRGLYPLKMFFNERTQTDEDTSSHAILAELKKIIGNEDKRHPMSDEQITAAMTRLGYNLARRTVAKYRERLGIPVARLRKEM